MASPWLNRLGHALALPPLRQTLSRLGFGTPVVVAGWPLAGAWAGRLDERLLIYDCMDDFPAFPLPPWRRRTLVEAEDRLAREATVTVVTSEALAAKWRARGIDMRLVPNGVAESFLTANAAPPADLLALPAPRLIYVGTIGRWLDERLLAAVARDHPQWSLALIGPVEAAPAPPRDLPNVHLLGTRPHAALPGYLAGASVALIPFIRSPLTVAVNPVKLYEYLALGLPVVATPLPELAAFADLCYLAEGADDFARAIDMALAEPTDDPRRAARRKVAAANTWRDRAVAFAAIIAAALAGPKGER